MMTPEQRHRILALTPLERLNEGWMKLGIKATHRCVRGPETGMVMVRGRIGGTGNAFNLGEMTMTRVSVVLDENAPDDGDIGHGWVAGRSREHAELVALINACAHKAHWARRIDAELIEPLTQALADERAERSQLAAATRVDFFTMVRGE